MTNTTQESLFSPEAVYISDATTQEALFKEVATNLLAQDFVKPDFLKNLSERERNYPTGVDMSVVSADYPNIAIPHTEGEFVNVRKIVPIKLLKPVDFGNMIDPEQKFSVSFLFMILNNDPEGQANVLAQIMDFLTTTNHNQLLTFFKSSDTNAIYQFLYNN
ncbi:PTS sugar transporter subunit IIA [Loigolactobacillus coryniformis]|uniref:PTS sugar transporter subunit IIA n=1 Tax=Loigolactobacillus coryniformis TaxID=1610 RepID=UPI001C5F1D0A|nr:PTS sugar transporter subunit IIA [Loigolactobacillus coryniformis]MBW4803699.1 PTS sugar transporter subunit IIA [Loigolactobacillus coryniformis subsp. torquens]MBW4806401.1 PTS sugar transporter subunit IIA [Loigolactobacillus coryniformis subsp. torquens]